MTKTLTTPQHALIFTLMTALFASSLLLAVMPAPARAAGSLTSAQIQAVLDLISAFGADSATVHNVDLALHGQAQSGTSGSVTSSPCDNTTACAGNTPTTSTNNPVLVNIRVNGSDGPVAATAGGTAALSWNSSGASRCVLANSSTGLSFAFNTSGSISTIPLTQTTTYTLTCTSAAGDSAQDSVVVKVGDTPTSCTTISCAQGYHASGPSCSTSQTCVPDNTTSAATFSASPTSGTAPLSVVFTSNFSGTITFGDGTSATVSANCLYGTAVSSGSGTCNTGSYFAMHTYAAPGTYTAVLSGAGACTSGYCAQASSATIIVNPATTPLPGNEPVTPAQPATFSASPTSGTAPLSVTFTGVGSSITFGDGLGQASDFGTGNLGTVVHTYQSAGTYTASSNNRSVVITVSSAQNTSPTFSASPTSGTAPLTVTFTTAASDAVIAFGDGGSGSVGLNCTTAAGASANDARATTCVAGSYVVTHTYSYPGTYTATYATPALSNSARGSYSVTVVVGASSNRDCSSSSLGCQSSAFDPAGLMAAVVMAPFNLMIDSLTNIFVMFGVGQ